MNWFQKSIWNQGPPFPVCSAHGDITSIGCRGAEGLHPLPAVQVGTDANAQLVRNALSDCGVNISHLREVEGPTGSAIISVDPEGGLSYVLLTQAAVDGAQQKDSGKAWKGQGGCVAFSHSQAGMGQVSKGTGRNRQYFCAPSKWVHFGGYKCHVTRSSVAKVLPTHALLLLLLLQAHLTFRCPNSAFEIGLQAIACRGEHHCHRRRRQHWRVGLLAGDPAGKKLLHIAFSPCNK